MNTANPTPAVKIDGGPVERFDSTEAIKSSHTSELVIALCGPIGSPLHKVAKQFQERLISDFAYDKCEIIKLSSFIEKLGSNIPTTKGYARTKALIDTGDTLRATYGSDLLTALAVKEIAINRNKKKEHEKSERHVPVRVCHIIDSIKNQEELETLRLVYRDMLYFIGVFAPLPTREKSLERGGMKSSEIYTLIDRDSGEELDHGQTVRDTFPQADFFLRVDADTDSQIKAKVERILQLILGTKVLTPTHAETAMYVAASAAGNSACLSRQVGASICDKSGEVLSIGWNDVPKFLGGPYTSDLQSDPNSEKDKRCWNLDGGICSNDLEKKLLSELLIEELARKGFVDPSRKEEASKHVLSSTKVKDLIEFSRSIHAEMHAILSAGHAAGDRMRGAALYCTTYPCHSCARHIVAAGITEVYYIEPYRKSLATKLHSDAITESESDQSKVRILPYDGVSPTRYLKLFRVPPNSRKKDGAMVKIDPKAAAPRFDKTLEALPQLEALVVRGLEEKNVTKLNASPTPKGANDA